MTFELGTPEVASAQLVASMSPGGAFLGIATTVACVLLAAFIDR